MKFKMHRKKRGLGKFDDARLKEPTIRDCFEQEVGSKWSVRKDCELHGVEEEWGDFKESIRSVATEVLGTAVQKKRAPWISAESLALVERKRQKRMEVILAKGEQQVRKREEYAQLQRRHGRRVVGIRRDIGQKWRRRWSLMQKTVV